MNDQELHFNSKNVIFCWPYAINLFYLRDMHIYLCLLSTWVRMLNKKTKMNSLLLLIFIVIIKTLLCTRNIFQNSRARLKRISLAIRK